MAALADHGQLVSREHSTLLRSLGIRRDAGLEFCDQKLRSQRICKRPRAIEQRDMLMDPYQPAALADIVGNDFVCGFSYNVRQSSKTAHLGGKVPNSAGEAFTVRAQERV